MNDLLDQIDAVIFDLGEVIIDLDYPKVIKGFSEAAKRNQKEISELVVTAPVLQRMEVGAMTPSEFRREVNDLLGSSLEEDAFDEIWNAMLKEVTPERMEMIEKIGERFQTYILSNTNSIHELRFNQMLKEVTGRPSLYEFVDNVFLSHDIGLRKPNKECFQFVIDDIDVKPERILFLDDRLDNVMGAQSCGLKALQITRPDLQLKEIFNLG